MISDRWRQALNLGIGSLFFVGALISEAHPANFRFDRDTLAFANATVFEYREGEARLRTAPAPDTQSSDYKRRCFVMTRTAMQFHKFARFEPNQPPLDDKTLAARVRSVTRHAAWRSALPVEQKIIFPGYANLRELSKARTNVLKENIGIGWSTYLRVGNGRMFFEHSEAYQEKTHANLDATLARGDLFVAYLSSYPYFTINHAILIYGRKPPRAGSEIEHYLVYDPNHPDRPHDLKWSPSMRLFNYEKDEEFVGGFVRVYQVYGKPLQ